MRAKRIDGNHAEIRDHLRAVGWWVFDAHDLGRGFPDLVVARRGMIALVEVKDGKGKRLNDKQQRLMAECPGVVIKATSAKDAETQLDLAEKYQFLRTGIGGA
jgi:hypothetical protein